MKLLKRIKIKEVFVFCYVAYAMIKFGTADNWLEFFKGLVILIIACFCYWVVLENLERSK